MLYKDVLIEKDKYLVLREKDLNFPWTSNDELITVLNYNWFVEGGTVEKELYDKKNHLLSLLKESKIFNIEDKLWNVCFKDPKTYSYFLQMMLLGKEKSLFLNIRNVSKNKTILYDSLKGWKFILSTGTCLFWADGVKALLENWKKVNFMSSKVEKQLDSMIIDFSSDASFTLYEYESLVRILYVITHIVEQGAIWEIRLTFPKIPYQFYAIDLFLKGKCTYDALMKYLSIISDRVDKITQVFKKRLGVQVSVTSPVKELESYLYHIIQSKQKISIDDVCLVLKQDPIWNAVLNVSNLNLLQIMGPRSEAVEEIKTSINNNCKLWVIVKNPKEGYSLTLSNDIVRKFSREMGLDFSLLWIYPLELINIVGGNSLYNVSGNNTLSMKKYFKY